METSYLWWCFISFFSAHLFNLFWVSLTFPSTAILCLCSSIWPWMNDNAIQILTSCTLGIAESPLLTEKKWEKTTTIQCWLFFLWVYYLCHVNSENFQRCHFVKQVCVCVFSFVTVWPVATGLIGRGNLTDVLWIQLSGWLDQPVGRHQLRV